MGVRRLGNPHAEFFDRVGPLTDPLHVANRALIFTVGEHDKIPARAGFVFRARLGQMLVLVCHTDGRALGPRPPRCSQETSPSL